MDFGGQRRLALWPAFVAGLLLLTLVLGPSLARAYAPPPAVVEHPDGSASVSISVTDQFQFQPNGFEVQPGQNVTVTVTQTGAIAHTFTLLPVANFSFNPSINSTNQIDTFLIAHHPLLNLSISSAGGTFSGTFTAPKLGVYQFVCLEPGHFSEGMDGFMGSGVAPPNSSPPSTGPGAAVFIIGGTIVALLVIAIVLGFVIGQRKGTAFEMPPQRLGYPEPPSTEPTPPPKHS